MHHHRSHVFSSIFNVTWLKTALRLCWSGRYTASPGSGRWCRGGENNGFISSSFCNYSSRRWTLTNLKNRTGWIWEFYCNTFFNGKCCKIICTTGSINVQCPLIRYTDRQDCRWSQLCISCNISGQDSLSICLRRNKINDQGNSKGI